MNLRYLTLAMITVATATGYAATTRTIAAANQTKITTETNTTAAPAQSQIQFAPATKNIHLMVNVMGLSTGKTDLHANLFATEQIAVSLGYGSKSEEDKFIKQTPASEQKVTVNTNLYTVGAAYYILDHSSKYNFIVNGLAAFQKKSDALHVETNGGLGLKLDAMYKFNNVAFNTGFQSTMIDGDSNTDFIVAVGYIF